MSVSVRFARLLGLTLALALSSGCVVLPPEFVAQFQAQQIAQARLTALAVVLIVSLPLGIWGGLVWGTKTLSLKSWWLLLTVECVLMAVFASARAYFS